MKLFRFITDLDFIGPMRASVLFTKKIHRRGRASSNVIKIKNVPSMDWCRMKVPLLPGRSCRVFGSLVRTHDLLKCSANRKNEAEEECGQHSSSITNVRTSPNVEHRNRYHCCTEFQCISRIPLPTFARGFSYGEHTAYPYKRNVPRVQSPPSPREKGYALINHSLT